MAVARQLAARPRPMRKHTQPMLSHAFLLDSLDVTATYQTSACPTTMRVAAYGCRTKGSRSLTGRHAVKAWMLAVLATARWLRPGRATMTGAMT